MNQIIGELQRKKIAINTVLADVHDNIIPLDHDITKQTKEIVKVVINDYLINTMKIVSVLFRSLYENIDFTGSFYNGLRIGEATEFDLNVVLSLGFFRPWFVHMHA